MKIINNKFMFGNLKSTFVNNSWVKEIIIIEITNFLDLNGIFH